MKSTALILSFAIAFIFTAIRLTAQETVDEVHFNFYGDDFHYNINKSTLIEFTTSPTDESINAFYNELNLGKSCDELTTALKGYKTKHNPDDWIFYQLVRKTADQISPKASNYNQYTLYKWFLLGKTGYDVLLTHSENKILFYVFSNENIYNIPNRMSDRKQYVCLNYHDYGKIDFAKESFAEVKTLIPEAKKAFSYRINQLPNFDPDDYQEKDLHFSYYENDYHFKVRLTPQIQKIFANYPVVDYEYFLNIPLSRNTYSSLIPVLKRNIRGLSTKNGVDYLMRFTRNAFLYGEDTKNFGDEKRLSPEQTLFYEQSDCEDRVALFFYLVKEIYDLPMIVLAYPKHVTIAVEFEKPIGKPIIYNGIAYSVCEPTPQKTDLSVGQMLPDLNNTVFEVAYVYEPRKKR